MRLDVDEDGFQVDTLARLPKTTVAFDAYRTSGYSTPSKVIPYEVFEMQIGGGMVLSTGVFTAPIAGIYTFTGTWHDASTSTHAFVYIRKNGSTIGDTYSDTADRVSFGMTVLVSLAKGDTIETYLGGGAIYSGSTRLIHFTGHIISPM
jgi:hypothetical protein